MTASASGNRQGTGDARTAVAADQGRPHAGLGPAQVGGPRFCFEHAADGEAVLKEVIRGQG